MIDNPYSPPEEIEQLPEVQEEKLPLSLGDHVLEVVFLCGTGAVLLSLVVLPTVKESYLAPTVFGGAIGLAIWLLILAARVTQRAK